MATHPPMPSTVSTQRPPSIRSVASTTSTASGASLSRRARTRTRAKTFTASSSLVAGNRADAQDASAPSELPYLDERVDAPATSLPGPLPGTEPVPPRPPRSPYRMENAREESSNAVGESSVPNPSELNRISVQSGSGTMPVEDSVSPQHGAMAESSTTPPLVSPTAKEQTSKFRDSQQSFSSSSLYPPSTSTASQSTSAVEPEAQPEVDEISNFDSDDVSYRLRLLVNNNYFLPPAHSKPSASDFANSPSSTPRKPSTPTFLDIFRVGRSRSRGLGTGSPPEPVGPVLRTTSDSTTAGGYVPYPQARSLPTTPILSSRPGSSAQDRTGRVVVVREKMSDLVTAAKQAEIDMKTRSNRRDQGSQRDQTVNFDDIIDPTDAVDLPRPSASYPFAVQASAVHGLGVEESLGAAVLAERLPPPQSPGVSVLSPEEYAWRKALLHAAVGHSLQNSPAVSVSSPSPVASTPINSPRPSNADPQPHQINTKRLIGLRILHQPLIEHHEESSASPPHINTMSIMRSRRDRGLASPDSLDSLSKPPDHLPRRAESPTSFATPLAPPPRRVAINPLYSLSQSDLAQTPEPHVSFASSRGLRKAASSPRLSNSYEAKVGEVTPLTPPPVPDSRTWRISPKSRVDASFETNRAMASIATTTDSHWSEEPPRHSATFSAPNSTRPSLSEYSQPSPTASAFQDALNYQYPSSSRTPSIDNPSPAPPVPSITTNPPSRYSTMSPPPPRVSSSLASIALTPPPRSSSLQNRVMPMKLPTISRESLVSSDAGYYTPIAGTPEPGQLPERIAGRRGIPALFPIQIPDKRVPVTIHSAPPPSSPTSFFDSLQSYPNAMDDLDSSSGEDDDSESGGRQTPVYVNPRTRAVSNLPPPSPSLTKPTLTRFGNHSTPYIARSYERRPCLPIGRSPAPTQPFDSKKPVGNVPSRPAYFSERKYQKSDQGHGGSPVSPFDLYKYKRQYPTMLESGSSRRPSTGGLSAHSRPSHQKTSARDSLKRLDGMLIQHMEAERDTIKRIATSVHTKS